MSVSSRFLYRILLEASKTQGKKFGVLLSFQQNTIFVLLECDVDPSFISADFESDFDFFDFLSCVLLTKQVFCQQNWKTGRNITKLGSRILLEPSKNGVQSFVETQQNSGKTGRHKHYSL